MIVAIDGPAGSGKSTLAKALSKSCNLSHLDTGAMYRSVTWKCLEENIDIKDVDQVIKIAENINIEFKVENGKNLVFVDKKDVTDAIRLPIIDKNVSDVAKIAQVRAAMVERQRTLGAQGDVVAEGRDIGTVVFPNADVKIFLVANDEARAHRRAVQQAGGDASSNKDISVDQKTEQEILEDLKRRDKIDSTRDVAPLCAAKDAHHIDTSTLTIEEEVKIITELINKAKRSDTNFSSKKTSKKRSSLPKMKPFFNRSSDYYDNTIKNFPWYVKLIDLIMALLVFIYTRILWPWKIEDKEKLFDATRNKGVVIVMNHVSMLDPIIPVLEMMFRGRYIRPVFKQEFSDIAIARWFFSRVGGIPVKRGTADLKCIRRCQRALEAGDSVLIYPEGTRVKKGEESHIHGGFALMAQMASVDVVPVAIVGARDITPRGKHIGKPGRVYLKVGDPISFADLEQTKRKAQIKEMEDKAMKKVFELRDELREEHPTKM